MVKCWAFEPSCRPTFSDIYGYLSNYLEKFAGYLEMNFNPFENKYYNKLAPKVDERLQDKSDL